MVKRPAAWTQGPDMDMRTARTLTGSEGVAMMDIYDVNREELRIGPFRSVWKFAKRTYLADFERRTFYQHITYIVYIISVHTVVYTYNVQLRADESGGHLAAAEWWLPSTEPLLVSRGNRSWFSLLALQYFLHAFYSFVFSKIKTR